MILTRPGIGASPGAPLILIPRREAPEGDAVIGLVNLMPRAAMRKTESQFKTLLVPAASGRKLQLRLFAPSDAEMMPNPGTIGGEYEPLDALWHARLDGLIVTGMEPAAATMAAEPAWPMIAKLVDWAAQHTVSTIWSCFAAHAAVYRQDGITRIRMPEKLSGVFGSMRAGNTAVFRGIPRHWSIPHSRYNTLSEPALRRAGYTVLMHAPRVGPDVFTKRCGASQFLYLQGHPEYGPRTLLSEYVRDVKRFAAGISQTYPKRPACRFDPATVEALARLQEIAMTQPAAALLPALEAMPGGAPQHSWREPARRLFAGWLDFVEARRVTAVRTIP